MRKYKLFDQEKILEQVKRLDEQEEAYRDKIKKLDEKKEKISQKINDGFQVVETEIPLLQLRERFLQNKEIKTLVEKYHIPIDKIALVRESNEHLEYPFPWMPSWSHDRFKMALEYDGLRVNRFYLYGGPENNLKVLFRSCKNGRYVLVGYMLNFPEKKMNWKAVIQGKTLKAA